MKRQANELTIGTRGSNLALWQAEHVADLLRSRGLSVRLVTIVTKGDRNLTQPLAEIGDKGLFTAELDDALIKGRIDIAVHSLKDLPSVLPEELCLAAVPRRGSPWDAMVARSGSVRKLSDLPPGASIGSSSLRRVAQVLAARPDLNVLPVRGNVETRLRKLRDENLDAIILAEAGLTRLGLEHHIAFRMSLETMLPAVGQGALGVVCLGSRTELRDLLSAYVTDPRSLAEVLAERAFLRTLEGGCQVPIGAYCLRSEEDTLELHGCVATLDGSTLLRDKMEAPFDAPEVLGTMLAERLIGRGADRILDQIRAAR